MKTDELLPLKLLMSWESYLGTCIALWKTICTCILLPPNLCCTPGHSALSG